MLKSLLYVFIIGNLLFYSNKVHFNSTNLELKNDTIVWSNKYRLVWDDFKGKIPENIPSHVKAQTQSGIYVEEIRVKGKVPKYKIEAYFLKMISWTKVNDENILLHEQLHFDISELYARKLKKSFDSLKAKNVVDRNVYKEFYNSNFIKLNDYQDQYDKEVYFDDVAQEEWINKIAFELQDLSKYE
jgi:hypothetical protein